jgi:hypothetical protein
MRPLRQKNTEPVYAEGGEIHRLAVKSVAESLGLSVEEVKSRFLVKVGPPDSDIGLTQAEIDVDPDRPVIFVAYVPAGLPGEKTGSPN